jgi:hypothetical protein
VIRNVLGAVALVAAELYLYLYLRYDSLDGQLHYWLHGLLGWGLGLSVLALLQLRARDNFRPAPVTAWEAVAVGHLYSAFPDILFLTGELLHAGWMDVFALHITIHFIPGPVLSALVLFLLATVGYGLAMSRRRRAAAVAVTAAAAILAVAVTLAAPLPESIDDLRNDPRLALHSSHHDTREPPSR